MSSEGWGYVPDSGGVKIPERVKHEIKQRIEQIAESEFKGRYTRLDIHFRAQFCYVDAYREPNVPPGWPPDHWPGSREEHLERLRNTPIHLCRLRHFGQDRWGFGFFTYSNEKYETSVFPDGDFLGSPEDAFRVSADVHLND